MNEHVPPDEDVDDTDAGYRDTLEERAYEDAATSAGHDAQGEESDEDEDEADKS